MLLSIAAPAVADDRADRLFGELRCLVCRGESIAASDAEVARDIRRLVRERLSTGESESDIRRELVSRYGETILLAPPLAPRTAALWTMPGLLAAGGIAILLLRRRRT